MLSRDNADKIAAALHKSAQELELARESLPRLRRLMNEWERGGLPGVSIAERVSGDRERIPSADKVDRDMRRHVRRFLKDAELIERRTAALWELMGAYLHKAGVLEDDRMPCKNPPCENLVGDGERTCTRCRMHKSRHGLAWPQRRVTSYKDNSLR